MTTTAATTEVNDPAFCIFNIYFVVFVHTIQQNQPQKTLLQDKKKESCHIVLI